MNAKMKRRMVAVAGVVVIVVVLLLAFLGSGNAAKVVGVSDVARGGLGDAKIQVTGTVVDNSYAVDDKGTLTFRMRDENGADGAELSVSYDKGVSATFGNGITAICTGRLDGDGVLQCSELVTKCPSKYENAGSALTVGQLLGYGDSMLSKTAKVSGTVVEGSLADATASVRLSIADADGGATLPIVYSGALSDGVAAGAPVVVTGALQADGSFLATDVALEG